MSIIGHSIQNSIANVHVALKQQQADEAAMSDEDARRHVRIQREEQMAREAVREAQETRENRTRRLTDEQRRKRRGGSEGQKEEGADAGEAGSHLDLFA